MIKRFEVLRPVDFPYRLIDFQFLFYNIDTPLINLYHAAGMSLVYKIVRVTHVYEQNQAYQLWQLQNMQEPHDKKYNWILIKLVMDENPQIPVNIEIENEERLALLHPDYAVRKHLTVHKLPVIEDGIVLNNKTGMHVFHHFLCNNISQDVTYSLPVLNLIYLQSYYDINDILNLWMDEENGLKPL